MVAAYRMELTLDYSIWYTLVIKFNLNIQILEKNLMTLGRI